jgi:hypothetical protein
MASVMPLTAMKIHMNRFILFGWILYIVSLTIPWSEAPFGGWLSGGFWQGMNLFPFYYLVTFQEANLQHIGSYTLSLSVIIMFLSPLLLFLLNRTANKYYGHIIVAGFFLAVFSFCFELFYPKELPYITLLFVSGYCVYISSFGVLSIGFVKQKAQIKHRKYSA